MKFQSTTSRQSLLLFVHDKDIFVNKKNFSLRLLHFLFHFTFLSSFYWAKGEPVFQHQLEKKDDKSLKNSWFYTFYFFAHRMGDSFAYFAKRNIICS